MARQWGKTNEGVFSDWVLGEESRSWTLGVWRRNDDLHLGRVQGENSGRVRAGDLSVQERVGCREYRDAGRV